MGEQSGQLWQSWRDAAQKFDYFMAGLAAAMTAYMAQTFELDSGDLTREFAWSPLMLELVALVLMLLATVAAFKRIEALVSYFRLNAEIIQDQGRAQKLLQGVADDEQVLHEGTPISDKSAVSTAKSLSTRAQDTKPQLEKVGRRSKFWYDLRNGLLLLSLFTLVVSRVWAAYPVAASVGS